MDYNTMSGVVPGGAYKGIAYIPGDVDGEWVQGKERGLCPACKRGTLFDYWQEPHFHTKCDWCGYLHDTGIRLPQD